MTPTQKRREQRKRAKMKLNKKNLTATEIKTMWNIIDTGPCVPKSIAFGCVATQSNSNKTVPVKKENPMYVDYISNDKHIESGRLNYLLSRMEEEASKIWNANRKKFFMDDDQRPYTTEDLVKRIQDGKFILPTKEEEKARQQTYWSNGDLVSIITWRDPANVKDGAGFDAAEKLRQEAKTKCHDEIMSGDYDRGLKAIEAFAASA